MAELTEEEMHKILREAVMAASYAADTFACVSIHVGTEVWDFLHSLATVHTAFAPDVNLLYGYPLVLEKDWKPGAIQVRTTRVIA